MGMRTQILDYIKMLYSTAIGSAPTADSAFERIKAMDVLTEAGGSGDLADIRAQTEERVAGRTQIKEVSVTSAANAGNVIIATVTTQPCLFKSVVLHADTAQTADLTSAAIYGGAANVITLINAGNATQANLDAVDKQVAWEGRVRLDTGKVITIDLVGTGATAVDLTVTIEYDACADGAYLA